MELPNIEPYINKCGNGTAWYGKMIREQMQEYARQAVLMERKQCALICTNHAGHYLFSRAIGRQAHMKDANAIMSRT